MFPHKLSEICEAEERINKMDDNEIKIISEKLSLIIKLMISNDKKYQKMTSFEKISIVNYERLSSEQISSLLDIPLKTVRNILPKLRKNEYKERN